MEQPMNFMPHHAFDPRSVEGRYVALWIEFLKDMIKSDAPQKLFPQQFLESQEGIRAASSALLYLASPAGAAMRNYAKAVSEVVHGFENAMTVSWVLHNNILRGVCNPMAITTWILTPEKDRLSFEDHLNNLKINVPSMEELSGVYDAVKWFASPESQAMFKGACEAADGMVGTSIAG